MKISNKLIFVSLAVLIVLIFFTFLFQRVFQQKQQQTANVTPAPTGFTESARENRSIKPTSALGKFKTYKEVAEPLSAEENQKVQEAKDKLPYYSDEVNIEYSDLVGQFIVSEKTPQADQVFKKWLEDNGLTDIYDSNPGLFAETDFSLSDYTNLVKKFVNDPENLPDQSRFPDTEEISPEKGDTSATQKQPQTKKTEEEEKQKKDLKLLVDLMKTLLSFDLAEIEQTSAPTSEQAAEPNTLCKTAQNCAQFVVTSYSANDTGNPSGSCPIYDPSKGKTYHTSGNAGGGCPIDDVTIAVKREVISPYEHPPVPVCMFYAENPGDPVTAHRKLAQDTGTLRRGPYQIDLFFADSARMSRWGVRTGILVAWPSDCTSSK